MKSKWAIMGVLVLAAVSLAWAGGMVSSGGDLLRDSYNPWWVKNTTQVAYCVQVDATSFSADSAMINAMIEKAIGFWQAEFGRRLKMVKEKDVLNALFNEIGVGTQQFVRGECSGKEDLRFQFGFGTLTDEQKALSTDWSSHIGLTIRTQYNQATLKGRGFIYIASDIGPSKYDGGPKLVQAPWQYEMYLYLALVHELGHVFGLPHSGEAYSLMSAQFVEFELNNALAPYLKNIDVKVSPYLPLFFFPSDYFVHCEKDGFSETANAYLGIPNGTQCLHFSVDRDKLLIYVLAGPTPQSAPKFIGTIDQLQLEAEVSTGIVLYLTDRQTVFPPTASPFDLISGPFAVRKKGSGTYHSLSGLSAPLFVDLNPRSSFSLVGLVGGSLRTILSGPMELFAHD